MAYAIFAEGITEAAAITDALKARYRTAASRAINKQLDRTRTDSAREIRKQINFPAAYLSPRSGRLTVSRRASPDHLEGAIRAQHRATSLARFVTSGTPGKAGVTLQVSPGIATRSRRMFLLKLPQGSTKTDTKFNLGLAIRLKEGERLQSKKKMVRIARGLYLLYGPSVSQVFKDVAEDEAPQAVAEMEREFLRLLEL